MPGWHQDHNSAQREFQSRRLAKLETQRRKLMDAYCAGAIDVAMLREEQHRIGREIREVEDLLRSADDTLAGWTEVIEEAMSFATNCGRAYRVAKEPVRKQFNVGVFHRLLVRDGRIAEVEYQEPFGPSAARRSSNNDGWSGRRDSNPRPSAWEADALPTELLPRGAS